MPRSSARFLRGCQLQPMAERRVPNHLGSNRRSQQRRLLLQQRRGDAHKCQRRRLRGIRVEGILLNFPLSSATDDVARSGTSWAASRAVETGIATSRAVSSAPCSQVFGGHLILVTVLPFHFSRGSKRSFPSVS